MKLKNISFLISLLLLTVSHQSLAADDLSDASTGTFSTDLSPEKVTKPQSQEEKPEQQNDEYNSFGENLYNQNVDTSPYELDKKKKKNQKDDTNY
jgi:hypothetical protein